ncbi:MAG: hypothetical protein EOP24_26210 [Hyphomicrobiales bacterium]|nr:MAG: hypothetical protein EOP24_26210 [Hyphomicrobiales bacterium]
MTLPAPYPADTRAKGWRFEIDYEKVEQSDTWALAPAEVRPWLLMLWLTAWRQTPCGSLPPEDALIAARIGMPSKAYQKHRDVLRRGWWLADDGRLYHDTIIGRVLEMLEYRRKNAQRVATHAAKKKQSPITNALAAGDSQGTYDTGTGTGTIPTDVGSTRAGEACKAMRAAGLQDANPAHPKLAALLLAGVSADELTAAAADAVTKGKPFAYALAVAEGRRRDAVTSALPAAAAADPDSRSAIEAEGVAKGIGKWNEIAEQWHSYKARVRGRAPSLDLNALAGMAAERAGAH